MKFNKEYVLLLQIKIFLLSLLSKKKLIQNSDDLNLFEYFY